MGGISSKQLWCHYGKNTNSSQKKCIKIFINRIHVLIEMRVLQQDIINRTQHVLIKTRVLQQDIINRTQHVLIKTCVLQQDIINRTQHVLIKTCVLQQDTINRTQYVLIKTRVLQQDIINRRQHVSHRFIMFSLSVLDTVGFPKSFPQFWSILR
jgi:glucose-6-phosphate-specific signal transduction histidine kinase